MIPAYLFLVCLTDRISQYYCFFLELLFTYIEKIIILKLSIIVIHFTLDSSYTLSSGVYFSMNTLIPWPSNWMVSLTLSPLPSIFMIRPLP